MNPSNIPDVETAIENCIKSGGAHFDVASYLKSLLYAKTQAYKAGRPPVAQPPVEARMSAVEEAEAKLRADVANTWFVYCEMDWYKFDPSIHRWSRDCEGSALRFFMATEGVDELVKEIKKINGLLINESLCAVLRPI